MNYYELKFTYESPIEATIISDVLASEPSDTPNNWWKARTGTKNGKKTISSPSVSVTTASSALLSTNRNRVIHIIL